MLRREVNDELRKTFNVREFKEQCFFMDSVFGAMQGEYQSRIAASLPGHMRQVVILVAGPAMDA